MPPADQTFKFRAFLSYRASDVKQAEWLHRKLEEYVVPRSLVGTQSDYGVIPKRLGRIFRDRDEARSVEQIERVISEELAQSQHLIVLCTPNTVAPGSWVPREIALFRARRPTGAIHAVIGSGRPPDVFPTELLTRSALDSVEAPLAADLRPLSDGGGDGEERALIRLIAGLLGVGFDDLWRREERRRRARRVTRTLEVVAVAAAAVGAIALGNFYRTRAYLSLELASIVSMASDVRLQVTQERPDENRSEIVLDEAVSSPNRAHWIPAGNLIVRVTGRYRDNEERAVSWHLVLEPGFAVASKRVQLTTPSKSELESHPGMAHVPATTWIHGREREPSHSDHDFWIDIRPPTVLEYARVAQRLLADNLLRPEESFLLTARQQSAAVDATGLGQLRTLGKDLGDIFGVIAQGTSTNVSAPGDFVVGLVHLPCETCPAPMTRLEADVYCGSRGMRLPTALEWELAVRGVDGRDYPWGNRFDGSRANVPGLTEKGAQPPALVPVDRYRSQRSPFGLYDTVGNAGDWVVNDLTSYERIYMGATYRFNPEDATAFRMLPVTDSDYLVREITARCVR